MSTETVQQKDTRGVFPNTLLWVGAAISIAEIATGMLIAPLGWKDGLIAIVLGHIIGGLILFCAGYIGAQTKMNAMDTIKISYGSKGGYFFSFLNVIQLTGWTAVMIINGAMAMNLLIGKESSAATWLGCAIIGGLIFLWVFLNPNSFVKVNSFTVVALVALCLALSYRIAIGDGIVMSNGEMTFAGALELSIAMPISWVPVMADYMRDLEKPTLTNLTGNLAYNFGSAWMFIIGMGGAILTGTSDVAELLVKSGLGIAALVIVILSTVTTTYLDARSAAVSFRTIYSRFSEREVALVVVLLGIVIGAKVPFSYYENFLYFIGSCFLPMIVLLIVDYFVMKRHEIINQFDSSNAILWFIGFFIYRQALSMDLVVGATVPTVVILGILAIIVKKVQKAVRK